MSSDIEKGSRLNVRLLGLRNRTWLILGLFFTIVVFTQRVLPSTRSRSSPQWSNAHLKPINYLNQTAREQENPFSFCPAGGEGDLLAKKYGSHVISQTRLHLGSGARIQRVLRRALKGESVTISVIGGSVSACHGAGDDLISPSCYPSRFFQWWNTVFPHPASELTNGALRRSSSQYFAFCNAHHIPDMTDLIILEFDVDDPGSKETLTNFELLVRSLLIRNDVPAVLILGHFSPQVQQTYGWSGPEHWHTQVATFYDVPHISTKSILYPSYMVSPSSIRQYYADPVLANPSGHALLSDVLISYFQTQICRAWDIATGRDPGVRLPEIERKVKGKGKIKERPDADTHGLFGGVGERKGVPPEHADTPNEDHDETGPDQERKPPAPVVDMRVKTETLLRLMVPAAMIDSRPGERQFEEIQPWCVSANDLINPLPPSLFHGSGWYPHHPATGQSMASQSPSAHYFYSTLPTSKLRIPLQVGAGDIGVYFLRESVKDIGEGSAASCWVDDNVNGAVTLENAAADLPAGETRETLVMIDHHVSRGSHYVECQLVGEEEQSVPPFKIVGIFTS